MKEIKLSADELVAKLLHISVTENICLLDSCGVDHLGSHLLIAGVKPLEIKEITQTDTDQTLFTFDKILRHNPLSFFTISYDFGLKLENIKPRKKEIETFPEPDIFLSTFDCLIIHDYATGKTYLTGNEDKFEEIEVLLSSSKSFGDFNKVVSLNSNISSNFTKTEYISIICKIQELIRAGETYQTNLTQQFRAKLAKDLSPQQIFWNLRKNHPAPFAAFIKRKTDYVVSISPERFFTTDNVFEADKTNSRIIKTSPIKGTRPRGKTPQADLSLKNELLTSEKDRAENTMIVDLLRNDIGRVCQYGTVKVDKFCDLEVHPSLYHLVSTVSGNLREDVSLIDIVKAIFPCGSITGCPKIRTMQIIDELETVDRGLSMGAIGYSFNGFESLLTKTKTKENLADSLLTALHSSVAIRTMVIRNDEAIFNVGGGIVIDSDPLDEYKESLVKAKALFNAIGIKS